MDTDSYRAGSRALSRPTCGPLYPPGRAWLSVKRRESETPRASSLEGALAGLGFAVTLVNITQPELLEDFIGQHAEQLSAGPGFSRGVQEVLDMWHALGSPDTITGALSAYEARALNLRCRSAGYRLRIC